MKFTSPVYSAASGAIAGLVYSRNRYGMYTRARAVPVNPNTIRQQDVRSALASMVVYWSATLTGTQRAAWEDYASNTPVTDALGQSQILSGQSMFLRTNSLRTYLGLAVLATAPTTYNLGQPITGVTSMTVLAGVNTTILTLSAPSSTTCTKLGYIGTPISAGRSFFKGPYQLAFATSGTSGSTSFTIPRTYATAGHWLAQYQPAIGDRLPFKARLLYDDGRLSLPYSTILTVV